jgi:hypothetical protein
MTDRTRLAVAFVAGSMLFVGCATTSGNAPTSTRSGFDGARVVDITAHGVACSSMLCPGIGAQWNSKRPDSAIVSVKLFGDFIGISGAAINVDGNIIDLGRAQSVTNFSRPGNALRESSNTFVVPMALVRSIASAQRAWLRVVTTQGTVEDAIIDGPKDSKAYHALKRFLAQVDAGGA